MTLKIEFKVKVFHAITWHPLSLQLLSEPLFRIRLRCRVIIGVGWVLICHINRSLKKRIAPTRQFLFRWRKKIFKLHLALLLFVTTLFYSSGINKWSDRPEINSVLFVDRQACHIYQTSRTFYNHCSRSHSIALAKCSKQFLSYVSTLDEAFISSREFVQVEKWNSTEPKHVFCHRKCLNLPPARATGQKDEQEETEKRKGTK